ncbi:hypothetical protein SDC9_04859 [bioreactor metagenome]|uniref:Uncharacterized protein n=1 Tax=bioreactor metagenome TaxID=1076179 RepID=A0A644SX75_9ZZZZ
MYDVLIIGAGPAGSSLARLIGDKYKVLLIDSTFAPWLCEQSLDITGQTTDPIV